MDEPFLRPWGPGASRRAGSKMGLDVTGSHGQNGACQNNEATEGLWVQGRGEQPLPLMSGFWRFS